MPEAVLRWVDANVLGWLQSRERKALKFTVLAQLAILVAMIGLRAIPLVTGQTVLVRFGREVKEVSRPLTRLPVRSRPTA